jgi:DNA-binding transcriptional regulator YiaG
MPEFTRAWRDLGLTHEDLSTLESQILDAPESGRLLSDLGGVRALTFKCPKSSRKQARVYYGLLALTHAVFVTAVNRKEVPKLSAADRVRVRRQFLGLQAAFAPLTEKGDLDVLAPRDYDAAAIRSLRSELAVSQAVFAELLGVSKILLQSWEQGVRTASPLARRLLDVINEDPSGFIGKCTKPSEGS